MSFENGRVHMFRGEMNQTSRNVFRSANFTEESCIRVANI